MKRTTVLIGVLVCLSTAVGCAKPGADSEGGAPSTAVDKPTEMMDQVAYSFGVNLGANLKQQDVEFNTAYLFRGIEDALADGELMLSQDEMAQAMQSFEEQMMVAQQGRMSEMAETNRAEGEAFLAENGMREGVTTLPSGLQYEVIQEGSGPKPTPEDRVTVHYRGSLIDGNQFDSSYDRGQPATFQLGQVIPGWSEGVQLMSPGAIYKFFIPGPLAYAERPPPGGPIGPDSALVFVVELISVE